MKLYQEVPGHYIAEWIGDDIIPDLIEQGVLIEVTEDDETMWCFRHSEEISRPNECYKHGYKGECDVALAHMFRYDE